MTHGVTEIQNEVQREAVKEALLRLWDAMNLSRIPSDDVDFTFGDFVKHSAHHEAYGLLGRILLGDDYPEKEILT